MFTIKNERQKTKGTSDDGERLDLSCQPLEYMPGDDKIIFSWARASSALAEFPEEKIRRKIKDGLTSRLVIAIYT